MHDLERSRPPVPPPFRPSSKPAGTGLQARKNSQQIKPKFTMQDRACLPPRKEPGTSRECFEILVLHTAR